MAGDGDLRNVHEGAGLLKERFSTPEEEEALAMETLGTAGVAGMGPQVRLLAVGTSASSIPPPPPALSPSSGLPLSCAGSAVPKSAHTKTVLAVMLHVAIAKSTTVEFVSTHEQRL